MEAPSTKRLASNSADQLPTEEPAPSAADQLPRELWAKIVRKGLLNGKWEGNIRDVTAVRLLNRAAADGGRKAVHMLAGYDYYDDYTTAQYAAVTLAIGYLRANSGPNDDGLSINKMAAIASAHSVSRWMLHSMMTEFEGAIKKRDWAAAKAHTNAIRAACKDGEIIGRVYEMGLARSLPELCNAMRNIH